MQRTPRSPQDRALCGTLIVLLVLTVVLHVVAARTQAPNDGLWGVHVYAFFPRWVLLLATVGLLGVVLLSRSPTSPLGRRIERIRVSERGFVRGVFVGACACAAAIVFWCARARHTLLGDGNMILLSRPFDHALHPREPLTVALDQVLLRFAHGWMNQSPPEAIAQRAWAVGSVLAGALFVPIAAGLAREIAALATRGDGATSPGSRTPHPVVSGLLAGTLLAQGYVQLFCGYVENYTYFLVALGAYVWLALRFIARRSPLWLPGCVAVLGIGLHLSAAIVLPSLAWLSAQGVVDRVQRRRALRDLAVIGLAFGAISLLLAKIGAGYNLPSMLLHASDDAMWTGRTGRTSYLFSWGHLRDFANEQLLIGPLGLLLFAPAAFFAVRSRSWRRPAAAFLGILGLTVAGVSFAATGSNLGYARNWDILAPGGLALTAGGLGLFLDRRLGSKSLAACLVWAVAMSLYHTLPWIAVNASEERGLARMATLPLGGGRAEMVVGNWYLRREQLDQARVWLEKSRAAYPGNISTCYLLGVVYSKQGKTDRAVEVLQAALEMRPGEIDCRRLIAATLVDAGRFAAALPHLEKLAELQALSAADSTRYFRVLETLGSP